MLEASMVITKTHTILMKEDTTMCMGDYLTHTWCLATEWVLDTPTTLPDHPLFHTGLFLPEDGLQMNNGQLLAAVNTRLVYRVLKMFIAILYMDAVFQKWSFVMTKKFHF